MPEINVTQLEKTLRTATNFLGSSELTSHLNRLYSKGEFEALAGLLGALGTAAESTPGALASDFVVELEKLEA